jgi:hypothetical protein
MDIYPFRAYRINDLFYIGGKGVPFFEVHDNKHGGGVTHAEAFSRIFNDLTLLPSFEDLYRAECAFNPASIL